MKSPQLWIILLLSPAIHASAQQNAEQYFDHYTTASGLSNNAVTGIMQDSTGYMWISTASGLNRFNGYSFVQFHSNSDSLSLPSEEIFGMSWLDKRKLAIFTSGLHVIDTKTGKTKNIFVPYHDLLYQFKYNMIERVLGDEKGNIYVLTRSGFYHFDENGKLLSRFDYYPEEQVPVTHFFFGRELFELDDHRLLIVSIAGFYIYDKTTRTTKKMEAKDCPEWAGFFKYPYPYYTFFQNKPGEFFVLKTDSDSIIYVNTITHKKIASRLPFATRLQDFHYRSKLFAINDREFYITGQISGFYKLHFNPASGKLALDSTKYFPSYLCTGLLKDQEQHLWVATTRGLFRQNNQRGTVQATHLPQGIDYTFPNIGLDDIYVSGNRIYAAGRGDAGLFIFDKASFRFEKQLRFAKENNHIRSIIAADPSTLLLATNGSLVLFDKNTQKEKRLTLPGQNTWSSDLARDRKGNIWITSDNIYTYHPSSDSFTLVPNFQRLLSIPVALQEDTSGNIWIAGHGLARYNTTSSRFDIMLDSFPYIKMPDKQVNFLTVDGQNKVWFNSNNNGLTSYDIATGKFRQFTRSDGLPDNNVASLYALGNQLWIATYEGIACMDLSDHRIIRFGKEDGFPEMRVMKGARFYYDSTQKKLYIGMGTAVVRFDPVEVLQRKSPPRTFIESMVINGKTNTFLPEPAITTSWEESELKITIGTINFSDGNSEFAYRIRKDNRTQWTYTGGQPTFSISSLSPGTHVIEIKAYSPFNRWPEQVRSIKVTVLPPLWQKSWFILLLLLAGASVFYFFIKWRTGLARKKEMEKTNIQKLQAENYKNKYELEQVSNYFSSSLAGKKNAEEVLWDVAQNLIGRMNYEDCMIYLWNSDKTKMIQKAAYGKKGEPEFISKHRFDVLPGQGVVGHVMTTRQPYLVADSRTEPRYRVDEAFRLSEVCVPIIHNDELVGVIDSEHHQPGYFSERDIQILTTIATLIGNKLQQLESEQSLDATHKQLDTINEQLAEARLSALQAQMNPHFVFNALNSIKRMILDGDNEKASRYLSKFALMIRMTLNHSKELFVTLDENITYLKSYLEMEQLRFGDSFTYNIETDNTIDTTETCLPSLMIQPLVENAIWHGLMPSETDKKIWIRFTENNNRITCVVEDNGIGIRQSEKLKKQTRAHHHSVGLENLKKRIKIMNEKYALAAGLEIYDLQETGEEHSGTRAILALNMINV
jgi:putative methionine-R-sulfoxide reductase with GAF domain/streptogramin lyase